MPKWKIITAPEQLKYPGIYQEKIIVMTQVSADQVELLKYAVLRRGGELADLPEDIQEKATRLGTQAFAFWANKTNPFMTISDIRKGNLRMQIEDDE